MKQFLILSLALFLSACSACSKEEEDFSPYPGGQCDTEQAR